MSFAAQGSDSGSLLLPGASPVDAGDDELEGAPSATAHPEWGSFGSWSVRGGERKALTEKAREICRLHVTGMKQVEIAEQVSCSVSTVGQWLRSEIGRREVERLRQSLEQGMAHPLAIIQKGAPQAAQFLVNVAAGEVPGVKDEVRLRASQDVLDRAGISRTPHEDAARFALIDSREQLAEIKRIGLESRRRIKADDEGVIDIEAYFDTTREQVIHVADSHDDGNSGAPDAEGRD